MEELLQLLRDGHSRSIEMLAAELKTTTQEIARRIEFLEKMGMLKRTFNPETGCPKGTSANGCAGCPGCHPHSKGNSPCSGCLPEGGFKNMGEMWEVIG
jgi:hypothetical protein